MEQKTQNKNRKDGEKMKWNWRWRKPDQTEQQEQQKGGEEGAVTAGIIAGIIMNLLRFEKAMILAVLRKHLLKHKLKKFIQSLCEIWFQTGKSRIQDDWITIQINPNEKKVQFEDQYEDYNPKKYEKLISFLNKHFGGIIGLESIYLYTNNTIILNFAPVEYLQYGNENDLDKRIEYQHILYNFIKDLKILQDSVPHFYMVFQDSKMISIQGDVYEF